MTIHGEYCFSRKNIRIFVVDRIYKVDMIYRIDMTSLDRIDKIRSY